MATSRVARLVVTAVALACTSVLGAPSARAEGGIGIAPAKLTFDDALRGGSYSTTLILENGEASDVEFSLEPAGDIAPWVSFTEPDDRSQMLTSLTVRAGDRADVRVQVNVPNDAANGAYTGSVNVLSRSVGTSPDPGNAAAVGLGASVDVSVAVTGTEHRQGLVTDVAIDKAEVGMRPRLLARVANTGNVGIDAVLAVAITEAATGRAVALLGSSEGFFPVDPGQQGEVFVAWDTTDQRAGDYLATLTVVDRAGGSELVLGTHELAFRLEPRGTFTRRGDLEALQVVNQPERGGSARLRARFVNTGEIETQAVLVGGLYADGELVEPIESQPLLARAGTGVVFDIAVPVRFDAQYRVEVRVSFDGEQTPMRTAVFRVGASGGSGAVVKGIALAVSVFAVVGVLFVASPSRQRRRRQRKRARLQPRPVLVGARAARREAQRRLRRRPWLRLTKERDHLRV